MPDFHSILTFYLTVHLFEVLFDDQLRKRWADLILHVFSLLLSKQSLRYSGLIPDAQSISLSLNTSSYVSLGIHSPHINISHCVSVLLICPTSTHPSLTLRPPNTHSHSTHSSTQHTHTTHNTHNTQHTTQPTANRQPPTKNLRRLFGLLQFEFEFMVYGRSENKS